MSRNFTAIFCAAGCATFLAMLLYALGFIGNVVVPKSLGAPGESPVQTAVLIDVGLLALFAVQHGIFGRRPARRWLIRFAPASVLRCSYAWTSSAALLLVFWQWRPFAGAVWHVQSGFGAALLATALLVAGFAFGWSLVFAAATVISDFGSSALRQASSEPWRARAVGSIGPPASNRGRAPGYTARPMDSSCSSPRTAR